MKTSGLGAILFVLLLSAAARADDPPAEVAYSPYEQSTIDRAVKKLDAQVDPAPEGKVIEGVEVVTLDVIEDRDPAPAFLNWFHVTTRKRVVEREILERTGERWDASKIYETARNLRDLDQLSLVVCVPLKGSAPDRVKLLVVTKDVWSIRLNTDFQFAGGKLQYLLLQPTEENLLGTHHQVLANFILDPGTLSFGAGYTLPRLAGSRVRAAVSGGVIVSRDEGNLEGSFGHFEYGQPLYSTDAEWSWGAIINWRDQVFRRFVGGNLALYDSPLTKEKDGIPYLYRSDDVSGSYSVTRSFGKKTKHDFTIGASAERLAIRPYDLSSFDSTAAEDFRTQLPVSETEVGPYFQYRTYSTEFMPVLDLDTLGLQEDYRMGHDGYLRLRPVTTALGSSRDFLGLDAGLLYTFPVGDGLVRMQIEPTIELAPGYPDASLRVEGLIVTPRSPIGRLLLDGVLNQRYNDYLNTRSTVGGDTRPRGYPTKAFIGRNAAAYTLEYRSRPFEILSCQIGGAAFLDAGDAEDEIERLELHYSAGFGVRALFPQLQRFVFRADLAFPFDTQVARQSFDIVVTFSQAFAIPRLQNL